MGKYYYDFHIHSCLSPCGEDESTPNSVAGMCAINGIQIAALTDHNTCRNCPAFYVAAKRYGVIPIAGMELTTMEDIHVVCLFENLEDALSFNDEIDKRRMRIANRPDLFGHQQILDDEDNFISEEPDLLITATDISIDEVPEIVERFSGICYPAHIDRTSNGIVATLGVFPESPVFSCFELHDGDKYEEYCERFPMLRSMKMLVGSDAHNLMDLRDAEAYLEIEDEPYSGDFVRKQLFKVLRGQ